MRSGCAGRVWASTPFRVMYAEWLEQAQIDRPLNGLRPRGHAELLVNGPELRLHRVPGNIQSGRDLQLRAGRQELQDAQLGRGQRLGDQLAVLGAVRQA